MTSQERDGWKNAALTVLAVCLFALTGWVGVVYASKVATLEDSQTIMKVDLAVIKATVERIEKAVSKQ